MLFVLCVYVVYFSFFFFFFFFFNDTATTEIYTLSLHDALPISFFMANQKEQTREHLQSDAQASGDDSQLRLKASPPGTFTLGQRIQLFLADWMGYFVVLLIGRSLRWEVYGKQHYDEAVRRGKSFIVTFWHREIFPAVWYWCKRGMGVMVSQNFDGEFISNVINRK